MPTIADLIRHVAEISCSEQTMAEIAADLNLPHGYREFLATLEPAQQVEASLWRVRRIHFLRRVDGEIHGAWVTPEVSVAILVEGVRPGADSLIAVGYRDAGDGILHRSCCKTIECLPDPEGRSLAEVMGERVHPERPV